MNILPTYNRLLQLSTLLSSISLEVNKLSPTHNEWCLFIRCDGDRLFWAIKYAKLAQHAVLWISNDRFFGTLIHSDDIHGTTFHTYTAPGAQFRIYFFNRHVASSQIVGQNSSVLYSENSLRVNPAKRIAKYSLKVLLCDWFD